MNPDKVVAVGVRHPGRRLEGRGEGRSPSRRDAAFAWASRRWAAYSARLIERSTTIPAKKSQVFSTAEDGAERRHHSRQPGQSARWRPTTSFWVSSISSAFRRRRARRCRQVEVPFDIDANGIVHVSAKDKATSKERVDPHPGLGRSFRFRDRPHGQGSRVARHGRQEEARAGQVKNTGRGSCPPTEKQLTENASNPRHVAAVKGDIEKAIQAAKEALAGDDADRIKQTTTALAQVAMKIGEAIYATKGPAGEGSGGDAGPETASGGDDNVVDADFEEGQGRQEEVGLIIFEQPQAV